MRVVQEILRAEVHDAFCVEVDLDDAQTSTRPYALTVKSSTVMLADWQARELRDSLTEMMQRVDCYESEDK